MNVTQALARCIIYDLVYVSMIGIIVIFIYNFNVTSLAQTGSVEVWDLEISYDR